MNNRQQRFIQNRKKEGKKRKSFWCTDLEWEIISYIRQHIELEYISVQDMVGGEKFVVYEDTIIPIGTIITAKAFWVRGKFKCVVFTYKNKEYMREIKYLRKLTIT